MRRDRASLTAAWVAGWRGLGHILGDDRLVADRFGARFGGGWAQRLDAVAARPRGRAALAALPPVVSWVGYMQVRTRLIDDALHAFLAAHRDRAQVVILGAGYDCRAARLPALAAVPVFEIDHPATQARKRAVLASLDEPGARAGADREPRAGAGADREVGARTAGARGAIYVGWDFEARPLAALPAALVEHGLDRAAPTFVIWEGVTMYLSAPVIDATLDVVPRLGGPGTQLCFNYLERDQLDRPRPIARAMKLVVRGLGEPFRFGWRPDELPAHLAAHGWRLLTDRDCQEAARELLSPAVARHVSAFGRRIATAVVA